MTVEQLRHTLSHIGKEHDHKQLLFTADEACVFVECEGTSTHMFILGYRIQNIVLSNPKPRLKNIIEIGLVPTSYEELGTHE